MGAASSVDGTSADGRGSGTPGQAPAKADDAAVARRRRELGLDDDDGAAAPAASSSSGDFGRSTRAAQLASSALGRNNDAPSASSTSTSPNKSTAAGGSTDQLATSNSGGSPTRAEAPAIHVTATSSAATVAPNRRASPSGSAHSWSPGASFQRRRIKLFSGSQVGTWRKGAVIGKGATGAVYEATDDATQGYLAVKEVEFAEDFADNADDRRRFEALRAEVSLLKLLDHPNVVRFLGIDRVGFNMYIMMEFVAGGSIGALIKRFKCLPEQLSARYTAQIVAGLTYLHENNIIHRDIKGANVLVSDDGVVKLADFGAAKRIMDPEQLQHTLAGTPYWMAPEVVRQQGHGKPADVWSLGATALQMLTGSAPYQELAPVPALFKIGHGSEVPVPASAAISPLARDFLTQCLTRNAAQRPTVEALAHHPWLLLAAGPDSLMGSRRGGEPPAMASPMSAEGKVAGVTPPSSVASPVPSVPAAAAEEGEVTEYLIALSFVHDDEAASAAVDIQRSGAQSGSPAGAPAPNDGGPTRVGAVTFDAPLQQAGGGAAGASEEDDDDLPPPEFDDEHFNTFVDTLSKK